MTQTRKGVTEPEHNGGFLSYDRGFMCEQPLNVMLLKPFAGTYMAKHVVSLEK